MVKLNYILLFIFPTILFGQTFWDGSSNYEVTEQTIIDNFSLTPPNLQGYNPTDWSVNDGNYIPNISGSGDSGSGSGSDNGSGSDDSAGSGNSGDDGNGNGNGNAGGDQGGSNLMDNNYQLNEFGEWVYDFSNSGSSFSGVTQQTQVDQDNDVPTLLQILSKLEEIRIVFDPSSTPTDTSPPESPIEEFTNNFEPNSIIPDNINPLDGINPSGSLPNTSISLPSIGGGSRQVNIDLNDSKFNALFSVANAGLTAVVVILSIRGTAWSTAQLLGS